MTSKWWLALVALGLVAVAAVLVESLAGLLLPLVW